MFLNYNMLNDGLCALNFSLISILFIFGQKKNDRKVSNHPVFPHGILFEIYILPFFFGIQVATHLISHRNCKGYLGYFVKIVNIFFFVQSSVLLQINVNAKRALYISVQQQTKSGQQTILNQVGSVGPISGIFESLMTSLIADIWAR